MKVAVTVWDNRISPVFDSAHTILITEIQSRKVAGKRFEPIDPDLPSRLAKRLTELGVSVLICGAISEQPADILEAAGIKLIPFIAGSAQKVLEDFAEDISITPDFLMPGCSQNYRRHAKSRLKHHA
ncbi:MAG: NifB/NifX family molybdenum-iron cluster-binding protein [Deltaproteobacteria bacterium]|nr:NifB/NifX family molybdenum-iron cluster-binding protein [Deltaproteobacteria bacterium]